jgi:3-deoxy-D-manno-octulosonic-acid transferase
MRIVIDFLYLLVAIAISPIALYRLIRHNRYRKGWAQRFGRITRKNPSKKCIWLHAVSVGEVNAATTVVKELRHKFTDYEIVVSTTTDTGFARANALFGKDLHVFYFPFDFSRVIRLAFRNIRPALCLLMELEVWPNFVQTAQQSGVPVVVVNGRISDRSFTGYRRFRPIIKKMFAKVTLVLAQTDEYARRFKELGCGNVIVSGSLKYDTADTDDKVPGADVLASQLNISCHCEPKRSEGAAISKPSDGIASAASLPRNDVIEAERLWVAGGTGNDEEAILLGVYQQLKQDARFADLRLAIVPRKPERFDEVAQLIKEKGFDLIRYSQVKKAFTENAATTEKSSIVNRQSSIVVLGDTMGDLRKFYSLANIIFVGRSLVPMGGSDMMEAAALGKCTIFGPHAFNFKQTVDALLADNGAILVNNKEELLGAMTKCLSDPDYAQQIAQNGRKVIIKNQGATQRTIAQIARLLVTQP